MSTPVDTEPTYRDHFDTLLPSEGPPCTGKLPNGLQCSLLIDCSGSTQNLFINSELGLISVFNLLGSFASRVTEEVEQVSDSAVSLTPFASRFETHKLHTEKEVQTLYQHATEEGIFNHLGTGTNLYDPLEELFSRFVEQAANAAKDGLPKIKFTAIVATDGLPTGGMESLSVIRDLCTKNFKTLQSLGYSDEDFNLAFITVRADEISQLYREEHGQTIEQWQEAADETEAFYHDLEYQLSEHPEINYKFITHACLRDVAIQGVKSFITHKLT